MNKNNYDKIYTRPVTKHAKQRITERTNLSLKKGAKNIAKHVFKYGDKIKCFTGEFYEYLRTKQIDGGFFSVRVYEENIYIFDTQLNRLLTVYPVPQEYLPTSRFVNKGSSPCIIWIKSPDGSSQYICENGVLTDDIGEATEFRTRQKAENYVGNNGVIAKLIKQGYKVVVLDIS